MRTWLITGCATGFGALLAQMLLDCGECVAASDRDVNALDHLRCAEADRLLKLQLDVTAAEQAREAVAAAAAHFGRIDLLVNNAGLGLGGPFEEIAPARVEQLFAVNVLGLMTVTRAVLPQLRAQGGGRIINLSSDSGRIGQPFQSVYCATKYAVEGFSAALAGEVQPFGIAVVLIEPCGFFATPMPAGALRDALMNLPADSPYHPAVMALADAAQSRAAAAQDPAIVVAAIIAAADAPQPSLRYAVGDATVVAQLQI